MLEPMIFPNNKSCSPFLDETIVVTNSGNEVPNAIIVNAIILSLNPKILAILEALSTTKLLPITIPAIPNITNNIDFGSLNCGFSSSGFLPFFVMLM